MSGRLPHLTPAGIATAGRDVPASFTFELVVSAGSRIAAADTVVTLTCREVYRLLPGRRLVARVEVAGTTAVIKLFLGGGAARYRDREAGGCTLLAEAGVSTPPLLAALDELPGNGDGARALLFAHLPDAVPVSAADQVGVEAAAGQLALLHRAGCIHRDLHLGNFLKTPDGAVYLVDGDGVRRARPGRRGSLTNLAVLCAQRPPLDDDRLPAVYEAYAAGREWPAADPSEVGALATLIRRQRRIRVRRYLRKAQRECTEYLCRRSWDIWMAAVRESWDDALAGFVEDPEAAFSDARMLKNGNSATVVRARLGDHWRVIKRYNVKGPWHAVRRNLRLLPRFRRAWLNGQRLHLLGIPTARPLALVEHRRGPWRGVAYLVMEDLGDEDLGREVEAVGLTERRLAQVTDLFRALDAAGLTHGDTKASNFLVTESGVALVDLDAMHEGSRGREADRRRFLANFQRQPEIRERFRSALAAAGRGGFAVAPRSL